jgi:beta-1,4-mannosyl-glycoprotein beta-1,4-N-acetylglucosaminyltransferase
MSIIDAFMFNDELDLLEVRLHELSDVVDKFVLVEATRTHTGHFKPLYYKMNKARFHEFSDHIIHIIVEDMPITEREIANELINGGDLEWIESDWQFESNWVRERFQRNAIMRGLEYADPDDIVIISDADEIVRASVVKDLEQTLPDGLIAIEQTLHTYYLNWKCTNMPWPGTKILRMKNIFTPSCDRLHTKPLKFIKDGGWHFNFLGGADVIRKKIKSYAHGEFNVPEVLDNIEQRLYQKKDALGRLYQYEVIPLDEHYPKYILDNLDKFSNWIWEEP